MRADPVHDDPSDQPDEVEYLTSELNIRETLRPRTILASAGEVRSCCMLLVEGLTCSYIDDRKGLRQLVAINVPGDFIDLAAYPLKTFPHSIATLTSAKVAQVPHAVLDELTAQRPQLVRKLWMATLKDAAIHRAWLFRLGRLDAIGRVAHFICEMNERLQAVGLSDGYLFSMALSRQDIAEICGLSPVHVSRVAQALRRERLCSLRSSAVSIYDLAALQRRGQFNPAYLNLLPEVGKEGPRSRIIERPLGRSCAKFRITQVKFDRLEGTRPLSSPFCNDR